MKRKHPPIPVIVLLVLALAAGGYFGIRALIQKPSDTLVVSGTIEAVQITISPEVSGKVSEVYFNEGDTVNAGDVLFRLDPTLMQAQRAAAQQNLELAKAALSSAEAQFTLVKNSVDAEAAAARTGDWFAQNPSGYEIPGGTFTQQELIDSATHELSDATKVRESAETALQEQLAKSDAADFKNAELDLLNARATLVTVKDVLDKANRTLNTDLIDAAQAVYDDAKTTVDNAQTAYDDLKDSDAAQAVLTARAGLTSAQERENAARDNLLKLQYGGASPRLTAANAAVDQAKAAVSQAEAQLALIDTQLIKLTISAPTAGTVMTRSIQPGEVIPAGGAAITLADLESLELTVYIPEDLYGKVAVGQTAQIAVDSFPEETFTATVIHISDQAEFTPRNVQTVEGRKTTVFAVKLQVENLEGKLKPGMPADVTFTR